MNGPDDEPEPGAAERVRLAHARIQRILLTAAMCMICWVVVAMLLLWAVS